MSDVGHRVTLAVVPRERWSLSVPSLRSVLENTPSDVELIYVDGGSPEPIRRELEAMVLGRGGTFIRHDYVLSANEARNIAIERSTRELIVFADNDISVSERLVEELVACADETGAAFVQPLILMGQDEHATQIHMTHGEIGREGDAFTVSVHGHEWDHLQQIPDQVRCQTQQIEFHAFLARRDAVLELDPFDEALLATGEQEHLAFRIAETEWTMYYEPAASVVFLQFVPLTTEDRAFWQLRWSEEWIQRSLDALAAAHDFRLDVGWPEESRRWCSQRRSWWYHKQGPLLTTIGRVVRRLSFAPATSRPVRHLEWRVMCGPGREAHGVRLAAGKPA